PGEPDRSILVYRISSTHPSVMMPELGKRLVHEEGVALVREWISRMPKPAAPQKRGELDGGAMRTWWASTVAGAPEGVPEANERGRPQAFCGLKSRVQWR